MLLISNKYSDLGITNNQETIINDCLFELSETDPNEVSSMLAEDGHLLESLQEKLIDLHEDMKSLAPDNDPNQSDLAKQLAVKDKKMEAFMANVDTKLERLEQRIGKIEEAVMLKDMNTLDDSKL